MPSVPLTILISPYHLTTGEAPAMAALLLADRVVTLLPAPVNAAVRARPTREEFGLAIERAPRYLRLLEAWRWTMPLWCAGVVSASHPGCEPSDTAADDIDTLRARIAAEDALAPLRRLLRPGLFDDPFGSLDALCADLLRGGPDPGLSMLVSAAVDSYAARHNAPVARLGPAPAGPSSTGGSLAQRAEAQLGRRVFALALPVLTRASAATILRLRQDLAPELRALRDALTAEADPQGSGDGGLGAAAAAYAKRFDDHVSAFAGRDDDLGLRIEHAYVTVTGLQLPADASLAATLIAARSVGIPSARTRQAPAERERRDPFLSLMVRPLAIRPAAGAQRSARAAGG